MSFKVTVSPSGRQFDVDDDEFILEAALRQGVVLPYGCRNGACGSCKARVVDGRIEQGPHADKALAADEAARGYALLCCSHAQSDLSVECRVVAAAGDIPIRKMPCRIASIEFLAPDVAALKLQLPANERLQYLAGQYLELLLKDGSRRSYSMASAPHLAEQLELHVRHMPGGRFTDALFGATQPAVKVRDILRLEGPMGTFFLREDSDRPIVLLASGTGFAPIKAIVEHLLDRRTQRALHIYWGARHVSDLYLEELCRDWQARHANLRYTPVLSEANTLERNQYRSGPIHEAVLKDFPDLSRFDVYMSGPPPMIEAGRRAFVAAHLPEDRLYYDSFDYAPDVLAALIRARSMGPG